MAEPPFGRAQAERDISEMKQENKHCSKNENTIFEISKIMNSIQFQSLKHHIICIQYRHRPFLNPHWTQALNGIHFRHSSNIILGGKKTYCTYFRSLFLRYFCQISSNNL